MNTSRKIQIALGTIFLWSSTSISSFAATNSITSEKFQSDSVKLPVESIPSKQLNSTQDTYLVELLEAEQEKFILGVTPAYRCYDVVDEAQHQQMTKMAIENFINQVNEIHLKQNPKNQMRHGQGSRIQNQLNLPSHNRGRVNKAENKLLRS
jgi:hypothetical protein